MPDGLGAAGGGGAAVGIAVGCAGTAVGAGPPLVDGTEVGAIAVGEVLAGTAVGDAGDAGDAGIGVAVAEEPQANMAANSNAKGPKAMNFGFLNQCFKMDGPPTLFWDCGDRMPWNPVWRSGAD